MFLEINVAFKLHDTVELRDGILERNDQIYLHWDFLIKGVMGRSRFYLTPFHNSPLCQFIIFFIWTTLTVPMLTSIQSNYSRKLSEQAQFTLTRTTGQQFQSSEIHNLFFGSNFKPILNYFKKNLKVLASYLFHVIFF